MTPCLHCHLCEQVKVLRTSHFADVVFCNQGRQSLAAVSLPTRNRFIFLDSYMFILCLSVMASQRAYIMVIH